MAKVTEKMGTAALIQRMIVSMAESMMDKHSDSKSNVGSYLLAAFIYDEIVSIAKAKSEDAWKGMLRDGIYEEPEREKAIEAVLASSPRFELKAKVTEPVKRFNDAELAELFQKSKFKVPQHVTKELVDKAKVGKKGNLLLSIEEKRDA